MLDIGCWILVFARTYLHGDRILASVKSVWCSGCAWSKFCTDRRGPNRTSKIGYFSRVAVCFG